MVVMKRKSRRRELLIGDVNIKQGQMFKYLRIILSEDENVNAHCRIAKEAYRKLIKVLKNRRSLIEINKRNEKI